MSRSELLDGLAAAVAPLRLPHPTRVAIDGVDAAGKTTLRDTRSPRIWNRSAAVSFASRSMGSIIPRTSVTAMASFRQKATIGTLSTTSLCGPRFSTRLVPAVIGSTGWQYSITKTTYLLSNGRVTQQRTPFCLWMECPTPARAHPLLGFLDLCAFRFRRHPTTSRAPRRSQVRWSGRDATTIPRAVHPWAADLFA